MEWDSHPPRDEAEAFISSFSDDPPPGHVVVEEPALVNARHEEAVEGPDEEARERHAWHSVLQAEYGDFFERKAAALSESGATTIWTDHGLVYAWLLRFSDGTGVLQTFCVAEGSHGRGMARLGPGRFDLGHLSYRLSFAVLGLGPGARPLP